MATINSTLISGAGAFTALLPLLAGKRRILLVTDANVGKLDAAQQIRALLEDEGLQLQVMDSVPAEPSQHDMAQILRLVSANQAELIVGIGGGSVLDGTKLLSRSAASPLAGAGCAAGRRKAAAKGDLVINSRHRRNRFRSHAERDPGDPGTEHQGGDYLAGFAAGLCCPAAGAHHQHARAYRLFDRH